MSFSKIVKYLFLSLRILNTYLYSLQREINVGKPFGLDAKIKISTEESGIDLYKLWDELKTNVPVFLASLPNPITSSRRTIITLLHNLQNSEIKELNFFLSIGENQLINKLP